MEGWRGCLHCLCQTTPEPPVLIQQAWGPCLSVPTLEMLHSTAVCCLIRTYDHSYHQEQRFWELSLIEPRNTSFCCLRPLNHKGFFQELETDDLAVSLFCMWKGNINISKRYMHNHASCSTGHSSQKHGSSQIAHKWMNEWVNIAYLHNELGTKDRQVLDDR